MNLSILPFLAVSVAEAHRHCVRVLLALFCFGQEKTTSVRDEGLVSRFKVSSLLRNKPVYYPAVLDY